MKYGNTRFRNEEGWWDSKREYARWRELKLLEAAKKIRDLRRQVRFDLVPSVIVGGRRRPPIRFVADFVYFEDGTKVVEDSKGFRNRVYGIKRHLMKHAHGIDIRET